MHILPSTKCISAQDRLNILLIVNTVPQVPEKVTVHGQSFLNSDDTLLHVANF